MKFKLIISLLLCSISLTVSAHNNLTITKSSSSQEILVTQALTYLNEVWANRGKAPPRNITEKYFDPSAVLIINGKKVFTGYDQFDAHFQEVGKHIIGKVRFPLFEVITAEDKLVVRFDEDIHDNNGRYYPTNVIAIFTLYKGRIIKWEEVVFTKYFFQADASHVVYSK